MPRIIRSNKSIIDIFNCYKNEYGISKEEFLLIVKTFNILLRNEILEGRVFSLPRRSGLLGIYKKPTYAVPLFNFEHYKHTGEKIPMRNQHSDGYAYVIRWITKWPYTGLPVDSRNIYKFKACRDFKRTLAKKIKEDNYVHKYYDDPLHLD